MFVAKKGSGKGGGDSFILEPVKDNTKLFINLKVTAVTSE